jgi:diaminopimelate epimerase
MHGCGNDYIYFDCFNQKIDDPVSLAKKLSDRHFGIGGDGIILVSPSDEADGEMRMFNADGSEGKMCGNGIRCVGKLLYDNGHLERDAKKIIINTKSGIKTLKPIFENNKLSSLQVSMGKPDFNPKTIPLNTELLHNKNLNKLFNYSITIDEKSYNINCVSMGNPHCVVFKDNIKDFDITNIGPKFENNPLFPERTNVEFVKFIDNSTVEMRVWERGGYETLACGTGACAVGVVLCELGLCKKGEDINVMLPGGKLIINYNGDDVLMTGNAVTVFNGTVSI